jgi:CDP-glucose 4,6-dehydratase
MSNILITGGNGVLGSSLSNAFVSIGNTVTVTEIDRKEECWRLKELNILDRVKFLWKSSMDIEPVDLRGTDIVIDTAIGFPDRPFCTNSPRSAMEMNISPALGILEAVRKMDERPLMIYPSSFNSLYGSKETYDECSLPNPASIYGWTKSSAEQLFWTYKRSFGIPIVITRVGSGYGEMMRTDELVAKLIISCIDEEKFVLRSPESKRLWTYVGDVVNAYVQIANLCDNGSKSAIVKQLGSEGRVLNIAGNLFDEIVTNTKLAEIIYRLSGTEMEAVLSEEYEPGELINGKPIDFSFDAVWSRKILNWKPETSLADGLQRTIRWFSSRYREITDP